MIEVGVDAPPEPREKVDRNGAIGKFIRHLRKQAKLTQAELAELVGVERTSITNIESGIQALTPNKLNAIADALGYTVHVTFRKKKK